MIDPNMVMWEKVGEMLDDMDERLTPYDIVSISDDGIAKIRCVKDSDMSDNPRIDLSMSDLRKMRAIIVTVDLSRFI